MKSCAYCGRENQDDATFCKECGTNEFAQAPTHAAQEKIVASPVQENFREAIQPGQAPRDLVELQRCYDPETLVEVTRTLEAAGIAYQQRSLPPASFDLSKIGSGVDSEGAMVVRVPRDLEEAARAAIEGASLGIDLPEDHPLLQSTDEELAEVVADPSRWSAFDVAHAKRLIKERGIDLEAIESAKTTLLDHLERGKPAPRWLLIFGWVFSALGGLIGLGIGWSPAYGTQNDVLGEFFTYDEASRASGKRMLLVAITVIVAMLAIRVAPLLSR